MSGPSKTTLAKNAVKLALEAAEAVAGAGSDDEAVELRTEATADLEAAEAAVETAGKEDDFAGAFKTIRDLLAPDPGQAAGDPPAAEPEPEPVDYHTVAPGKAITSKRGILGPGVRIDADDLPGGATALTGFVKSGHVRAPAG